MSRRLPLAAMGGLAVALVAFWAWSARYGGIIYTYDHPPLFGRVVPVSGPWAALGLAGAVVLSVGVAAVTPATDLRPRHTAAFLAVVIALGTAGALALGAVRGGTAGWTTMLDRTAPRSGSDYLADAPTVRRLGVRDFVERFPDLVVEERIHSVHSRTHPPGAVVAAHAIHEAVGQDTRRMAVVLTVLGLAGAVPAYLLGRSFGGRVEGRIAAVLFATAPSVLLFSTTSLDAPIAAGVSGAGALLVAAAVRRSPWLAVAGGAALGAISFLTYAAGFVGVAAAVATVLVVREPWTVVRLGTAMAAGLAAALGALWALFGFSLADCFLVDLQPNLEAFPGTYWDHAQYAAYAIGLGMPLLVFGIAGTVGGRRHVPAATLLATLVVFWLSPLRREHLSPGELERTWLFTLPYVAAAAAPRVAAWYPARRRMVILGLALAASLTAWAITVTYDTYW